MRLICLIDQVGKGKTTKTSTVGNKVTALISIIKRAEPYGLIDISAAKLNQYKKPRNREGDNNGIYLTDEEVNRYIHYYHLLCF